MSRSHKKSPVFKDGSDKSKNKKYWKRKANKKVRTLSECLGKKSNDYRKSGADSWDICDYRFYDEDTVNLSEEELDRWKKIFYRKKFAN